MYSSSKFSFMMFSSLMVVVMLQMLLLQTAAQVDVSVSPAQIDVGLSPSLDLNCTFSMTATGMAGIISLTLSRENNTELASITSLADHQANVISREGITADGVINPGGQSYIHLHWDYPTDTQKGTYLCIARGIDLYGHSIETVNASVVTVNQPEIKHLLDELKHMKEEMQQIKTSFSQEIQQMQTSIFSQEMEQMQTSFSQEMEQMRTSFSQEIQQMQTSFSQEMEQMQTSFSQEMEQMQTSFSQEMEQMQTSFSQEMEQKQIYITQLKNNVSSLNVEMNNQIDLYPVFLLPSLSYKNKRYFVSKAGFQDFNESITICKAYGGILAEMDDLDEYHAVQDYVKTLTGVDHLYIGGTDEGHDGTWVLPSSGVSLPVTDWGGSNPVSGETSNCLCLYDYFDWKMESYRCHWEPVHVEYRYMCEI